jgi:hypothetical protein
MINRVMCSIVDVSSCPENLVNSGTLNLGGMVSDHSQVDMVSSTCMFGAWVLSQIASAASPKIVNQFLVHKRLQFNRYLFYCSYLS